MKKLFFFLAFLFSITARAQTITGQYISDKPFVQNPPENRLLLIEDGLNKGIYYSTSIGAIKSLILNDVGSNDGDGFVNSFLYNTSTRTLNLSQNIANSFAVTFPYASGSGAGLVKVGNGLNIDNNGFLSASSSVDTRLNSALYEPTLRRISFRYNGSTEFQTTLTDLARTTGETFTGMTIFSSGLTVNNGDLLFPTVSSGTAGYLYINTQGQVSRQDAPSGSDGNNYVSSIGFSNGTLSLTRSNGLSTLSRSLNGQWLNLTGGSLTGTLNAQSIVIKDGRSIFFNDFRPSSTAYLGVNSSGKVVLAPTPQPGGSDGNNYISSMAYEANVRAFNIRRAGLGNFYSGTIPYASSSTGGLVKVGSGLSINGSGVLSASGGGGTDGYLNRATISGRTITYDMVGRSDHSMTLPYATSSSVGLVRPGNGLSVSSTGVLSVTSGSGGEYLKGSTSTGVTTNLSQVVGNEFIDLPVRDYSLIITGEVELNIPSNTKVLVHGKIFVGGSELTEFDVMFDNHSFNTGSINHLENKQFMATKKVSGGSTNVQVRIVSSGSGNYNPTYKLKEFHITAIPL